VGSAPERLRVDVGVVTFNTAALTVEALRRLLDSDQGVELRLLVRDNGSTDGTAEAIAAAVPEAHLDAGSENLGFAKAVNTLLARSSAPFFFLLNSDAWPAPGALRTLVEAAEACPRAAAVAPRLVRPDGSLEHSTYPFPSVSLALLLATGAWRLLGRRFGERRMLEGAWAHDRPRRVDWAIGAALLLRRSAVEVIGGFDERFFMYAEDLEWCWRARKAGFEVRFQPSATVVHVGNASGAQTYGARRSAAHLTNAYRFVASTRGTAATTAWWLANLAGTARLAVVRRILDDTAGSAHWRAELAAHAEAGLAALREARRATTPA
jgi:N-acetylglucosaminyl-diphospho-decaprenol L-rhamnosyltransferase